MLKIQHVGQLKVIVAATKVQGRVIVSTGNFVAGPLKLKSGVEFHLNNHAIL